MKIQRKYTVHETVKQKGVSRWCSISRQDQGGAAKGSQYRLGGHQSVNLFNQTDGEIGVVPAEQPTRQAPAPVFPRIGKTAVHPHQGVIFRELGRVWHCRVVVFLRECEPGIER